MEARRPDRAGGLRTGRARPTEQPTPEDAETSEGLQFGQPVWRAGKKVFAQAYCYEERWRVAFWVGVHAQLLMTDDPRYTIPPYMGHNGWISLDVAKKHSERELQPLALESYRHFALKKMLAQLPAT
jgi:predicted DNA-binding protein (MmcQ/YjbR family)